MIITKTHDIELIQNLDGSRMRAWCKNIHFGMGIVQNALRNKDIWSVPARGKQTDSN